MYAITKATARKAARVTGVNQPGSRPKNREHNSAPAKIPDAISRNNRACRAKAAILCRRLTLPRNCCTTDGFIPCISLYLQLTVLQYPFVGRHSNGKWPTWCLSCGGLGVADSH